MKRLFKPIETPLGFVSGRDGIYLELVEFKDLTSTVVLDCSFNTNLCSASPQDNGQFQSCKITFKGVLAIQIIELDSWDCESETSFDEIVDSGWIKMLGGKVTQAHRHFLLQTYDDVFEIVCNSCDIELTNM